MPDIRPARRPSVVLGAGVVLAATLATSLTAAGAASAQTRAGAFQVGPLVTETSSFAGSPAFSAPGVGAVGADVPANRVATLAEARAAAVQWFLPADGTSNTVRPVSDPDRCLTALTPAVTNASRVVLDTCRPGDQAQRFTLAANAGSNNPLGTGIRSAYNGGFLGLFNTDTVMRLQSKTVADRVPTLDAFVADFAAEVDSVDVLARTASLSGVGTPGATVLVNGGSPVPVGPLGTWTAAVGGLDFGSNTITLEQYEGDAKTGQATVQADLVADVLTFTATFPTDRDARVVASGRAHPGSEVRLFDADGMRFGTAAPADPDTGAWSTEIPAPDAGGGLEVTAAQFLGGARDDEHDQTRTVGYGDAVTIASPLEGAAHAGGPLAMSGAGEPGSAIEVHDVTGGSDSVVGSSVDGVLPNRRWTVTTDDLDRAEHVLRVVQRSRGANTTIAEVTINPGETGSLRAVTVETPATVTPGVVNTFTGAGEPDATYEVLNASGNPIVSGPLSVDGTGKWTFDRVVSAGATSFQFALRQTKDGQTETSGVFTIAANPGFAAVVVDTETVRPGETNTFSGTGPENATYQVLNASGTQIVAGSGRIDGDGDWSFDRAVSAGALGFRFKLRVTVDGATYTTRLFDIPADTR